MPSEIIFKAKFEVPKHISKKNQKRIGFNRGTKKPFIMQESKSKFIQDAVIRKLIVERLKNKIDSPIEHDVSVAFILTYPKSVYFTKQGKRSNKVLDLSNSIQGYEDALAKSGILIDDRVICSLDGSTRNFTDEPKYFVEIIITKV